MLITILLTLFAFRNPLTDFTLYQYRYLLESLLQQGYVFLTFEQYCDSKSSPHSPLASSPDSPKYILLRHDVDLKAANSLATAQIEHELGIHATYYFRVVPQSNQPEIIRAIADLGHEISYHYEDMTIRQGDTLKAYAHFQQQLTYFRQF